MMYFFQDPLYLVDNLEQPKVKKKIDFLYLVHDFEPNNSLKKK